MSGLLILACIAVVIAREDCVYTIWCVFIYNFDGLQIRPALAQHR
jgi:hypothetical protein